MVAACSRSPWSHPEPIHARPGTDGPTISLGMGTDELVVRIPGGESPGASSTSLAGAMELGPDDGARLAGAIARTLGVLVRGASATGAGDEPPPTRRGPAPRGHRPRLPARRRRRRPRPVRPRPGPVRRGPRRGRPARPRRPRISSPGGTGFSDFFLAIARDLECRERATGTSPRAARCCCSAPRHRASASPVRAAAVQEGVSTRCSRRRLSTATSSTASCYLCARSAAPLARGDLDGAEALAGDAAIAVRSARTFGRMAAWAAQLQSIQRLGARLSGLSEVPQIGHAIATVRASFIDYENAGVIASRREPRAGRDAGLGRATPTRTPTA